MTASGGRAWRTLARIGLQLYSVRAAMARDFDGTLARVAAIGYREVEFAGYFDHAPADVRPSLDRHGLSAPSAHIGTAGALTGDWTHTSEVQRSRGTDTSSSPASPKANGLHPTTVAEWPISSTPSISSARIRVRGDGDGRVLALATTLSSGGSFE